MNNVLDLTLYMLDRMRIDHTKVGNIQEADILLSATELYEDGVIDVRFEGGEPIFSITSGAQASIEMMKKRSPEDADIANEIEEFVNQTNKEKK